MKRKRGRPPKPRDPVKEAEELAKKKPHASRGEIWSVKFSCHVLERYLKCTLHALNNIISKCAVNPVSLFQGFNR